MGAEEIQACDLRLRRFPQAEARGKGEAYQEDRPPLPVQDLQESTSETLLQGEEVRAGGVISMADSNTGKFIKVRCPDCSNEQVAFKNPAMNVTCNVCGSTLIKSKGGAGEIRG